MPQPGAIAAKAPSGADCGSKLAPQQATVLSVRMAQSKARRRRLHRRQRAHRRFPWHRRWLRAHLPGPPAPPRCPPPRGRPGTLSRDGCRAHPHPRRAVAGRTRPLPHIPSIAAPRPPRPPPHVRPLDAPWASSLARPRRSPHRFLLPSNPAPTETRGHPAQANGGRGHTRAARRVSRSARAAARRGRAIRPRGRNESAVIDRQAPGQILIVKAEWRRAKRKRKPDPVVRLGEVARCGKYSFGASRRHEPFEAGASPEG